MPLKRLIGICVALAIVIASVSQGMSSLKDRGRCPQRRGSRHLYLQPLQKNLLDVRPYFDSHGRRRPHAEGRSHDESCLIILKVGFDISDKPLPAVLIGSDLIPALPSIRTAITDIPGCSYVVKSISRIPELTWKQKEENNRIEKPLSH